MALFFFFKKKTTSDFRFIRVGWEMCKRASSTGDVPESCFAVQGYGESRPVATNDTPEGRALNRRVEISLVPQANACQLPGNTPASSDDGVSKNEME